VQKRIARRKRQQHPGERSPAEKVGLKGVGLEAGGRGGPLLIRRREIERTMARGSNRRRHPRSTNLRWFKRGRRGRRRRENLQWTRDRKQKKDPGGSRRMRTRRRITRRNGPWGRRIQQDGEEEEGEAQYNATRKRMGSQRRII
jgi:hypothetical protein